MLRSLLKSRRFWLICGLLLAAPLLAYWPVRLFDFTNYDDPAYIFQNPIVTGGIHWQGVRFALLTSHYDFWRPLTWWSHMLDCSVLGLNPGRHHVMNLGIHLLNTLLLFELLKRMTGAWWRSAMVAALFGLHPVNVESVAWLSERKNVLSTLFWILCLRSYTAYARPSSPARWKVRGAYWLACSCFGLGLMAKPMIVTVPFVLLLLDFWPLGRFTAASASPMGGSNGPDGVPLEPPGRSRGRVLVALMREKLPFFGLSLASCIITYVGMDRQANILSGEVVPWGFRLANVPVSYARYLGKLIWPMDLPVLYPIPGHWGFSQVTGAILLLVLISGLAFRLRTSHPSFAVGWLFFLGTLVPTIGIVAMGFQSIANRYLYLPSIGVFVSVVWGVATWARRWNGRPALLSAAAVLLLLYYGVHCRRHVWHWQDSRTLWTYCLAVTRENPVAHNHLGLHFQNVGLPASAIEQYRLAVGLEPDHIHANMNLGVVLAATGRIEDATNYFGTVLRLSPANGLAHLNQGVALLELGLLEGAVTHCVAAIRADPGNPKALTCLGRALSGLNRSEDAIRSFQSALRDNPDYAEAHFRLGTECFKVGRASQAVASLGEALRLAPNYFDARLQLARVLAASGQTGEAAGQYRLALKLNPDSPEVCNNLAWILATASQEFLRDGREAVRLARIACERTAYGNPLFLGTLASAYAEVGEFDLAVETARKACASAPILDTDGALPQMENLLRLFLNRQPMRQGP